jgi:hypothetical protein
MFTKATKEAAKLRAAVFGPSGAGKTFTSLRLATGIGGRIALIDSERRTASKYADRFEFDVADLGSGQHSIDSYVRAIRAAAEAGYNVLIIDSLTHAWQELLAEVDAIAKAKYHGNTWSAWSVGTPKQRALVDSILDYPGHVIATMRSKTEWTTEKDRNGKDKPVRIGLTPEQGKGIEYEFDMLFELTVDHVLTVIKDRSGKFQDRFYSSPGEVFGAEMAEWLDEGAPPMSVTAQIVAKARAVGLTDLGMASMLCQCGVKALSDLNPAIQLQVLNTALNNPATIQSWNAGVDSRSGQPLTSLPAAQSPDRVMTVLDADGDPVDVPAGPEGEDPQEPAPSLAELRTHATIACRTAGLTLPGLEAFCSELTGGDGNHLDFVSPDLLAKIGRNGISPETVARCNAAGEAMTVADDDEPPAIWQTTEPPTTPSA